MWYNTNHDEKQVKILALFGQIIFSELSSYVTFFSYIIDILLLHNYKFLTMKKDKHIFT
jgi:hypothetical protein